MAINLSVLFLMIGSLNHGLCRSVVSDHDQDNRIIQYESEAGKPEPENGLDVTGSDIMGNELEVHIQYNFTKENITDDSVINEEDLPDPGLKARVTQKGLDYVSEFALEILMEEMAKLQIPDVSQNIAGIDVNMNNIHVKEFPRPDSVIQPIPGLGLKWTASGIELIIEADYTAVIGVGFFRIVKLGTVRMTVTNLSFSMDFHIERSEDGKPEPSVYDCEATGLIFFRFTGGWSDTLNFGATLGRHNIRDLILGLICTTVYNEVEKGAGIIREKYPVIHTIEDHYELDMSLPRSPEFFDEALELYYKGEATYINNGVRYPVNASAPEMPVMNETDKMAYVYITDFSLNSALYALYLADRLAYNISTDNIPAEAQGYLATSCTISLCLGTLFPEVSREFPGAHATIRVSALAAPRVEFRDGQILADAAAILAVDIRTPAGSVHIMNISMTTTAAVTVRMVGQRFTFDLVDIRPEARIVDSTLPQTDATQYFFDTIIRVATRQYLVPKLTELGREGFLLPELPEVTFIDPDVEINPDVPNVIIVSSDLELHPENF